MLPSEKSSFDASDNLHRLKNRSDVQTSFCQNDGSALVEDSVISELDGTDLDGAFEVGQLSQTQPPKRI
jgi:hypothetical protein